MCSNQLQDIVKKLKQLVFHIQGLHWLVNSVLGMKNHLTSASQGWYLSCEKSHLRKKLKLCDTDCVKLNSLVVNIISLKSSRVNGFYNVIKMYKFTGNV